MRFHLPRPEITFALAGLILCGLSHDAAAITPTEFFQQVGDIRGMSGSEVVSKVLSVSNSLGGRLQAAQGPDGGQVLTLDLGTVDPGNKTTVAVRVDNAHWGPGTRQFDNPNWPSAASTSHGHFEAVPTDDVGKGNFPGWLGGEPVGPGNYSPTADVKRFGYDASGNPVEIERPNATNGMTLDDYAKATHFELSQTEQPYQPGETYAPLQPGKPLSPADANTLAQLINKGEIPPRTEGGPFFPPVPTDQKGSQSSSGTGAGEQPPTGGGNPTEPPGGGGTAQNNQPPGGAGTAQGEQPPGGGTAQNNQPPGGGTTTQGEPPQGGGTAQDNQPQGGGGTAQGNQPQGGGTTAQGNQPQGGGTTAQVEPPQGGGGTAQGNQPTGGGGGTAQGNQPTGGGGGTTQGSQPRGGGTTAQGEPPQGGGGGGTTGQGEQPQGGSRGQPTTKEGVAIATATALSTCLAGGNPVEACVKAAIGNLPAATICAVAGNVPTYGPALGVMCGSANTFAACVAKGGDPKKCLDDSRGDLPVAVFCATAGAFNLYLGIVCGVVVPAGAQALAATWEAGQAEAAAQNQQELQPILDAWNNCDFQTALAQAQELMSKPPSYMKDFMPKVPDPQQVLALMPGLQKILPTIQKGAAAQSQVSSLLTQASSTTDQTQKQQLLNQALAAAGDVPCLKNQVNGALQQVTQATPASPPVVNRDSCRHYCMYDYVQSFAPGDYMFCTKIDASIMIDKNNPADMTKCQGLIDQAKAPAAPTTHADVVMPVATPHPPPVITAAPVTPPHPPAIIVPAPMPPTVVAQLPPVHLNGSPTHPRIHVFRAPTPYPGRARIHVVHPRVYSHPLPIHQRFPRIPPPYTNQAQPEMHHQF